MNNLKPPLLTDTDFSFQAELEVLVEGYGQSWNYCRYLNTSIKTHVHWHYEQLAVDEVRVRKLAVVALRSGLV